MKALWECEPFHQDNTRVQGMYHLFRQLVGQSTNIEVGFIVTRTESDLNWAFKVPQKERFTVYPRKILKRALQKAKCAVDDKKIHVVDYETISNKKAVDCLLTLADTRGTKHLEKVIEICKQVNAEPTVFHQAQVIYKWSLYEPNRNILSYHRKVNRTQSRIEQACKVIIASEFSPTNSPYG